MNLGCHMYMELYAGPIPWYPCQIPPGKLQVSPRRSDLFYRLRHHNRPEIYQHKFNAGLYGAGSPYLKVVSVSCSGCESIRPEVKCPAMYVEKRFDNAL